MIKISTEKILELAAKHPAKPKERPRYLPFEDLDNEIWLPIDNSPYHISNMGRVKVEKLFLNGKFVSGLMSLDIVNGMYKVKLTFPNGIKKRPYVHQLVLDAFHSPSMNRYCLFADGNKLNPKAENVSYVDRRTLNQHNENMGIKERKIIPLKYLKKNGQVGIKKVVRSPKTLEQIRYLNQQGINQEKLGEMFKICQATVSKIING